jgi:hypothetical protein
MCRHDDRFTPGDRILDLRQRLALVKIESHHVDTIGVLRAELTLPVYDRRPTAAPLIGRGIMVQQMRDQLFAIALARPEGADWIFLRRREAEVWANHRTDVLIVP